MKGNKYLLDFAVLHGCPGVHPGRDGGHSALLLPDVGLIPRLEQHNILQKPAKYLIEQKSTSQK